MNDRDEAMTNDRIVGRAQAHGMFSPMVGKPVVLELRESGTVTWRLMYRDAGDGE